MTKKSILLTLIIVILSTVPIYSAGRTISILEIKRAPGASTKDIKLFEKKLLTVLKEQNSFKLKSKVAISALVEKMGGCKKDDCFYSAAKEVGVELLIKGDLRKKRDKFIIKLDIIDTKFGEPVMEILEKIPTDIAHIKKSWMKSLVEQFEPLSIAAEELKVKETVADEALKATIIMDDELSGKLTLKKSPYLLIRNVIVPANKTLEIEPGVEILVGGNYVSIVVFGQLMARGTKNNPIIIKSAKKEPKLWDWDRIYLRGSTRSYLEYVKISNSNYGVYIDNGNATLNNCTFESNSISCVYAHQSNVQINNIIVGKGHIVAINAGAGSKIVVDSGYITNNSKAIMAHPYSNITMSRTRIENNDFGIIADKNAKVDLKDIYVKDNRIGVLSAKPIPTGKLFMIRGNDENLKIGNAEDFKKLLTKPEKITAVKVRHTVFKDTVNFKSGFASLPSAGESFIARFGLLGQVSVGMSYRKVEDLNSEVHSKTTEDMPHQTGYLPGLRPEFQVYLQSKVGDRESNLTLNGYGNYYSSKLNDVTGQTNLEYMDSYRNIQKFDVINLTTTFSGHEIVIGDFSYDKSELSISSRQVRGLKYKKDFKLKRNRKLTLVTLAGQSEIPYAVGLKPDMLDSSTTPVRQEGLAMVDLAYKVNRDLTVSTHGIFTQHTNDPFLAPGLSLTPQELYGADPRLKTLSGGANANLIFNDNFSAYAEVDLGYADTLSIDVDSGDGVPENYSKDTLIHHAIDNNNVAGLVGVNYGIAGFSGNIEFVRAQNGFYSGGNPSIKPSVGDLNKAKMYGSKVFELNLLNGKVKTAELNVGLNWEAISADESGLEVDTIGANNAISILPDSIKSMSDTTKMEWFEANNYIDKDFAFMSHENKYKFDLSTKVTLFDFSVEPKFSYYYETKPMYKTNALSNKIDIDDLSKKVFATEYIDNEQRVKFGAAVVYNSTLRNDFISNLRVKVDYAGLVINDMNDSLSGDADSTKWNKNDGMQNYIKGGISVKFLKRRIGNKLRASYKVKSKKYRDEEKTAYKVSDKFTIKIIPRKLSMAINGYYTKTNTLYNTISETTAQNVAMDELLIVYGGSSEFKLALSSAFSLSFKGGYEYGLDDSESGSENYKTMFGGLMLNMLF